jgi:HAD superfamily hydrolase (TIGR01490 family)
MATHSRFNGPFGGPGSAADPSDAPAREGDAHPRHGAPETSPAFEAAFFDVDGTLVRTNLVHLYAYYAFNTGSIADTAKRAVKLFGSLPAWWAVDKVSRRAFNEAFFNSYKGLSEDRLHVLSEELFEDVLLPAMRPGAMELVAGCSRAGARTVLITGALDFTMKPFARYLGVDEVICNRMEFVGGKATGRVVPPLVEGASKAEAMRRWAEKRGVSLSNCVAYTDSWSDYPMLAVVGHPTAVNPDLRLRSAARAYRWPVIDLER